MPCDGDVVVSLEVPGNPLLPEVVNAPADMVRPEHAVEMFRLLGRGVAGDLYGMPRAQPAILPGTTHTQLMQRLGWLVSMVTAFTGPLAEALNRGTSESNSQRLNGGLSWAK